MMRLDRIPQVGLWGLTGIALVGGLLLLGSSYLPFELVKAKMNTFSGDGTSASFTHSVFEQIVARCRGGGIALLLVSGGLFAARDQIRQGTSAALLSVRSLARESASALKARMKGETREHLAVLALVVLVAGGIRLIFITQPIRHDEANSFLLYASKPLYFGLSNYSYPNNHLFHTFLVHLVWVLVGDQPWMLRLPAYASGVGLVIAGYGVARIHYGKQAALLAAGLLASSSTLVEFSANARGYTLMVLIFLLILVLARYLIESGESGVWLAFSVLAAVGFYTMPIMLLPFGTAALWISTSVILESHRPRRLDRLRRLLIACGLTGLMVLTLYFPPMLVSGPERLVANRFVQPLIRASFLSEAPSFFASVWEEWHRDIPGPVGFLLAGGFLIATIGHRRIARVSVPLAVPAMLAVAAFLLAHPVTGYKRVWLYLLPIYLITAAAGVGWLIRVAGSAIRVPPTVPTAIGTLGLVLGLGWNIATSKSVYLSEETGTLIDAEEMTHFLKDYIQPQDIVVADLYAPLAYYFQKYGLSGSYLKRYNVSSCPRILVVAADERELQDIVQRDEFGTGLSRPREIRQFEFARLYEMIREKSGR